MQAQRHERREDARLGGHEDPQGRTGQVPEEGNVGDGAHHDQRAHHAQERTAELGELRGIERLRGLPHGRPPFALCTQMGLDQAISPSSWITRA